MLRVSVCKMQQARTHPFFYGCWQDGRSTFFWWKVYYTQIVYTILYVFITCTCFQLKLNETSRYERYEGQFHYSTTGLASCIFFVGVDATARRDIWHLLVKYKAGWFFKLSHIQSSHKYPYLEYLQIFCFGLLTVSFCHFQTLSPRYIRDDKLKTVP